VRRLGDVDDRNGTIHLCILIENRSRVRPRARVVQTLHRMAMGPAPPARNELLAA
jgi:hypothetical protein